MGEANVEKTSQKSLFKLEQSSDFKYCTEGYSIVGIRGASGASGCKKTLGKSAIPLQPFRPNSPRFDLVLYIPWRLLFRPLRRHILYAQETDLHAF